MHIYRFLTITMISLLVLGVGGCDNGNTTDPTPDVAVVEITPTVHTFTAQGDTLRFTAEAKDANGNSIPGTSFTWTSSASGVASVNAGGLVTAVDNGTASIVATADGVSGSASLTVGQTASSVQVTPAADTLTTPADTLWLNAVAMDANGYTIAGAAFEWQTSDPNVATVDTQGVVTAVAEGAATITASFDSVSDTAVVTIKPVATMISAGGGHHSCALRSDGKVFCWGRNQHGGLGDGSTTDRSTPVAVSGSLTFTSIRAGYSKPGAVPDVPGGFTCGVASDSTAYCWGNNGFGQLGDGTFTDLYTPAAVTGGLAFTSLDAGGYHTCGTATDGNSYCWGYNNDGQLGDGTSLPNGSRPTPTVVSGGLSFEALDLGNVYSCGVTTSGSSYCWGYNVWGQIGDGTNQNAKLAPTLVSGSLTMTSLVAGWETTCGVRTDNNVAYCWGRNQLGQLGDGTNNDRTTPGLVSGSQSFVSLDNWGHTCGVTTAGEIYCWGLNANGQLGDGSTTNRTTPVMLPSGLSFSSVTAGWYHTCGLATDGSVYCWGSNTYGQLGDGTTTDSFTPVRVLLP